MNEDERNALATHSRITNSDFLHRRDAMKPAEFFETNHFLENGETINSRPSAIFFDGGSPN